MPDFAVCVANGLRQRRWLDIAAHLFHLTDAFNPP